MTGVTFDDMVAMASREDTVAVLAIGKVARAYMNDSGCPVGSFRDMDLLVIGSSGRPYTRHVFKEGDLLFDVSRIDIRDFEQVYESKHPLWVGIMAESRFLFIDPEWMIRVRKVADGFSTLVSEGPERPDEADILHLRSQGGDYKQRLRNRLVMDMQDMDDSEFEAIITEDLLINVQRFVVVSFFELKGMWKPKEKNMLKYIRQYDSSLWSIIAKWLKPECCIDERIGLAISALDLLFEDIGGTVDEYPEGKYPLLR